MKILKSKKYLKGFTLIELLVVIAIIGILATIVLVSLNTARLKARDARRIGDLRQVQLALELYYDDQRVYPASATFALLQTCLQGGGGVGCVGTTSYMTRVPNDPLTASTYAYGDDDVAPIQQDYVLRAAMENSLPDNSVNTDIYAITCAGALEYCVRP